MRAAGGVIVLHLLLVLFHKIVEVKGLECSCHDCDPVIEVSLYVVLILISIKSYAITSSVCM